MTNDETMRALACLLVTDFLKKGVVVGHQHVKDYEVPRGLMPRGKQVVLTLKIEDDGQLCDAGTDE